MDNKDLVWSGVCLSLAGITLLISQQIGVQLSKILVPALFIVGGYFAYRFSRKTNHVVGQQFHLIQAVGMSLFGIVIAFIPDSLESFLTLMTYFVMSFGFLELIFGLMSLNTGAKINWNIIGYRVISGFLGLAGALTLLAFIKVEPLQGLVVAGILMLLSGLSFVVFAQKLKQYK